ncbi:MAG: GGDEF domain-containing protein [bacterium]
MTNRSPIVTLDKDDQSLSTAELKARIEDLEQQLYKMRGELREARKQVVDLAELADLDPLTGIMNRRALVRELRRVLSAVERYNFEAHFIFSDLNGLKKINDTHGHSAGDAILKHVGQFLSSQIRQTDAIGRLGGDEFGVILAHTNREMAELKMDQMARSLATKPLIWNNCALNISLSYGVFTLEAGLDIEQIMHEADMAMYADKKKFRK